MRLSLKIHTLEQLQLQRLLLATFAFATGLNPDIIKDWVTVLQSLLPVHVHVKHILVVGKMHGHGNQYSLWSSIVEIIGPIRAWPPKIVKLF